MRRLSGQDSITTTLRSLAMAVLLAIATAAPVARADLSHTLGIAGCASLDIYNDTRTWIWITVYDVFQLRHLDYGWITPHGMWSFRSGGYSCMGIYHLRAQVKGDGQQGGPDVADVWTGISGNSHEQHLRTNFNKVRLVPYEKNNYVNWDVLDKFWWSTNGNGAPLGTVDQPQLTITNHSPNAAALDWGTDARPAMGAQCINAGASFQLTMPGAVRLKFGVWGPEPTCASRATTKHAADLAWSLEWGQTKTNLRLGLVHTSVPAGARQYSFTNNSAWPVKFVVDGVSDDKAPCLTPGAKSPVLQLPASLPEGIRKVDTFLMPKCGAATGAIPLSTDHVFIVNNTNVNHILQYGFFPD